MSISTNKRGLDLLSIFDSIQIRNDEKISQTDREFCEHQQKLLYESLSRIDQWYEIFCKEAEQYKISHQISFAPDGSVTIRNPTDSSYALPPDYKRYEFKPFDAINEMTQKNFSAIKSFSNTIISYFNQTYNITVPIPDMDKENIPMGLRPAYTTYVDVVINHLGGKGFRETAEEEIIKRFHSAIRFDHSRGQKPEIKNDRIAFYDVIRFDEFYFKYNKKNHLSYNYRTELEHFCAGIVWAGAERLDGCPDIIQGLNISKINITDWYSLSAGSAEKLKFYKNGRIDIRFSDKTSAELCFRKLKLA